MITFKPLTTPVPTDDDRYRRWFVYHHTTEDDVRAIGSIQTLGGERRFVHSGTIFTATDLRTIADEMEKTT